MAKPKIKKPRPEQYAEKVHIKGSFMDVIRAVKKNKDDKKKSE
jgi:hypothetical protein